MSHAVFDGHSFLPVPEGVDLVQASAAKMGSIPYHGLRLCNPLPEEKIAIIGLGAIGHMAAKLYTAAGAFVVATDVSAKRVAQAAAAGVRAVIAGQSLKETFAPFFPGGADVVVDCTGAARVLPQSITVCRDLPWSNLETRGPRIVLQGSYEDTFTVPYKEAFLREMQFIVPRSEQDRDRSVIFDMIRRNALSLTSVISDVRNPAEAQKTYDQLREPGTDLLTVVFKWN
jgi:threonine dehydrogenase-like Zn-dependent dehydrogenase